MPTELTVAPLLEGIAAQAAQADRDRSVAPEVLDAIRASDIMRFTASENLGGLNRSCVATALELEAVAAACASTGWVLWNHLCTFHLFAGLLGPQNADWLANLVRDHRWVCFPAGASTAIRGERDRDAILLTGKGAFGSGGRYADYAGASFMPADAEKPRFALVPLDQDTVRIDPDWFSLSLRASATDTVHYEGARVDAARCVDFPFMYRVAFRDPERPMIHPRYREDWVALSDLWLGMMAVGVVQAALNEVVAGIRERIAIMGVKVADRPTVHVNLGQAQIHLDAARAGVLAACSETDQRISRQAIPTEADYLGQLSAAVAALQACDEALRRLVRVMGGNGLREGPAFERRLRDFQAMPLHINAHQDRVTEQVGRHALGLDTVNPF